MSNTEDGVDLFRRSLVYCIDRAVAAASAGGELKAYGCSCDICTRILPVIEEYYNRFGGLTDDD